MGCYGLLWAAFAPYFILEAQFSNPSAICQMNAPLIDSQHIKFRDLVTDIVYSVFVLTEARTFQNGGGWDQVWVDIPLKMMS